MKDNQETVTFVIYCNNTPFYSVSSNGLLCDLEDNGDVISTVRDIGISNEFGNVISKIAYLTLKKSLQNEKKKL